MTWSWFRRLALAVSFSSACIVATQAAPTVVAISRADANPTNAATVDYTVEFSEDVDGFTTESLSLVTSGTSGLVDSIIPTTGTTFTVTILSVSGDGTLRLDLTDGTSITSSNDLSGLIGTPYTGEVYDIDQTAPIADSLTGTDANPTSATSLAWLLAFSEPVTGVTSSSFALSGAGVSGTISDPTTTDGITWTVIVTSVAGDGTLGVDLVTTAGILDAAGNSLANLINGSVYTVDQTPPQPVSFVTTGANPTSGTTVQWQLVFSEPVTTLSVANLTLIPTGVTATLDAPVTTDGGTTWLIDASSIAGNGQLGIELTASTGILDAAGNEAVGIPFTGGVFDIDQDAPTVTSIVRADANPTSATSLNWTVTFSESVTTLPQSAFTFTGTGVTATLASPSTSDGGVTWNLTATGVSGDGTLGVDLTVATDITDAAGNLLSNVPFVGEVYTCLLYTSPSPRD